MIKSRKRLDIENPSLAAEWDYEKNGDLRPEDFTGASNKSAWWKCKLGHSWSAQINNRNISGTDCPYCSGRFAVRGVNDLVTLFPQLALEWDHDKNGDLKPYGVKPQSNRKAWWKCKLGHSWEAMIASRTRGYKCPFCAGQSVMPGFNDLATVYPQLAAEWDYEKNGDLKPTDVTSGSRKQVWWKCSPSHSWQASVSHRTHRTTGTNCPYCAGKKALPGFNDLATTSPHLVLEWDYEKNGSLSPCTVRPGSNLKVWWQGKCGHNWKAPLSERSNGAGCPICRGLEVVKGVNDLETILPYIALEWDGEKNGDLTPDSVTPGSDRKVWWKCARGHCWKSRVYVRTMGTGCPVCNGQPQMRLRLVR